MATKEITPVLADSAESRRYNRIKRWLGIADFAIGFGLLVVLLATGWTGTLRDLAERGASQNYAYAVFLYIVMLMLISKALGTPLDYYGFRLEHRYNLSNQRFRSWIWDEFKSLLIGLVMATIVVELLYMLIRQVPAALVGDRVGGFSRTGCLARATRAGCAVSDFLQIRTARKRRTQAPLDRFE